MRIIDWSSDVCSTVRNNSTRQAAITQRGKPRSVHRGDGFLARGNAREPRAVNALRSAADDSLPRIRRRDDLILAAAFGAVRLARVIVVQRFMPFRSARCREKVGRYGR